MANPEHVEIVRRGAAAIRAFREANLNVRFDLATAKLQRANLDLQGADLEDAILMKANLQGANLQGANLQGAFLQEAELASANLQEANLHPSMLRGAHLQYAYLQGADLQGADLQGADLQGARLQGANLQGANLQGAIVDKTIFTNLDLSTARHLESVEHRGPSSIGVDTLYMSDGKIPEIFLKGCGLPDEFIAYVPSFIGSAIEYYSCFISYSHEDKQFARQLHDRLQGKGIRCWLDEKNVNPGENLYDAIDRGIRVWDKVLLCASQHSLTSWWVDNEISLVLNKERDLWNKRQQKIMAMIPLNLDGYLFLDDWKSGYRQQVRDRVAADFTGWKNDADEFELQLERVVRALRTDGGKLPEPTPKL